MSMWSRLVFEKKTLGIPGVHSVGKYNYVAARAGLPPHKHVGCLEISLLAKGYQTYLVSGKTYHVKGGEQYVSLPGETHDTGNQPENKGVLYWLILDVTKDADKFLFLAPSMAERLVADLVAFPSRHFPSDAQGQATLDRAFKALLQVRSPDESTGSFERWRSKSPWKTGKASRESLYLLEAANHILFYILQTIAASRANCRPKSPVVQDSLDYIATQQGEWISLAQVAEKVHLSESYFKSIFRQEVGMPPAEYMLRQKVEAAKQRLSESDCNITELAYKLGFSSSQYFATVFRRFTNLTPSEFMAGHVSNMSDIS